MNNTNFADREVALECRDGEDLMRRIQEKRTSSAASTTEKRQHGKVAQLPNAFANLIERFRKLVKPSTVDFDTVWGIVWVNLKVGVLVNSS